jgi:hypothetical protein
VATAMLRSRRVTHDKLRLANGMRFLILDGPRDKRSIYNPLYRGTYRAHPTHCDALPDDNEINRLFFWFLEEGGELGVVRDRSKALRFAELWNARLSEKDRFEIVEVIDDDTLAESKINFVGFDLSSGYNNSLLTSGLPLTPGLSRLAEPIRELYLQICHRYSPQLNAQGLFESSEVASMCLRSMVALQRASPNFFEGGDLSDFHLVGLYSVSGLN